MIILITGKPGAGKSTVMEKLIELYDGPKRWVITREIRNNDGERVGFKAVNDAGESEVISHKHDIHSDAIVGQNQIDIAAVNRMFSHIGHVQDEFMLIDEIGPIQLLSQDFLRVLKRLFRSRHTQLVATIHLTDKRLSRYRLANNVMLVHTSDDNRTFLPLALESVMRKHDDIDALTPRQFKTFRKLLVDYLETHQTLQLSKLLNNALVYVMERRTRRMGINRFLVKGNHGPHIVRRIRRTYECDCDLFKGKGVYEYNTGVCSHVQAVQVNY
ncbi:MAG: nucleoside-triphosphatase [Candidatus Saccharimonas sp.]